MKTLFPLLRQIESYDRPTFRSDLAAGLTVEVMLIPQGMAYALIAGMPPIYGLYASLVPLVVYAFLGTSRQLARPAPASYCHRPERVFAPCLHMQRSPAPSRSRRTGVHHQ